MSSSSPAVPFSKEVVVAGMKAFEDHYNADDTAFCGTCYTDPCDVQVLVGPDRTVAFAGTKPTEVAAFLNGLRNNMGGTNMNYTITEVTTGGSGASSSCCHKDTWVADNGTGTCDATWTCVDGQWKICKDVIQFFPKGS